MKARCLMTTALVHDREITGRVLVVGRDGDVIIRYAETCVLVGGKCNICCLCVYACTML